MRLGDSVLLTGAGGFVGSAVARKLAARGLAVRALVRNSSRTDHLDGLGLELVQGDLRDAGSLRAALAGTRFLFHVAADYRLWARDPSEIVANNVDGTRAIMQEAKAASVERIVYTSSVAAISPTPDGTPADETRPLQPDQAVGAYKRSKVLAERLVEAMIQDGLPAIIVNPSTPIGPCDVKPTPTGRIVIEAASGRMPAFVDTGLNFVHVDDVAAGHLAAMERGNIGEQYILGGQDAYLAEFLAVIAEETGRRAPRLQIPRSALVPLAFGAEQIARLTGHEPFLTLDGLRMSEKLMFFSSAKAERELGYSARPYRDGVKDAIAWFRKAGYLAG
jgi:dihydroflavonol-4-reductase